MKEVFEKIIEKLEEKIEYDAFDYYKEEPLINMSFEKLEDIINQVAEEYNNGWIPCSGCSDCVHKECEHYGKV